MKDLMFENVIIIKPEWFRFTCPVLRITTERMWLNKIGASGLGNPKYITVSVDLENKSVIVSATEVAEDHTDIRYDLFRNMNWDPSYKYMLFGKEYDGKLLFKLERVMVSEKKG